MQSVCNRAIVLQRGKVVFDGSAVDGVNLHFRVSHANQYAEAVNSNATAANKLPKSPAIGTAANEVARTPPAATLDKAQRLELSETRQVVLNRISILPVGGGRLIANRPATVTLHYRSLIEVEAARSFAICTRDLHLTIASCASGHDGEVRRLMPGEHTLSRLIPELILHPGVYALRGGIYDTSHRFPLAILG